MRKTMKNLLQFCMTLFVGCLMMSAQAAHPLYSKHAKICGKQALSELMPILTLMQSQVIENHTVADITLAAVDARPFAAATNVTCQSSILPGNLTAFRCTGTLGTPCGVITSKKFICRFLDAKGNEGFHNNATEGNTSMALVPAQIQCDVCMPTVSAGELTKLAQFHNVYMHSGEVLLIADPTGTTCW